jgi:integrase
MHYARDFYRWCVRKQKPYFSKDVLNRIESHVIGGNAKGRAVRSEDPDVGPLTELEVQSLCIALRAAYIQKSIPLRDQVAVLLCLAFGANASQYAMMRESDVKFVYENDQLVATLIQVPRHKKRGRNPRDEFKVRKVNKSVSSVIEEYIASNRDKAVDAKRGEQRPLFWGHRPKNKTPDMVEWTWHIDPSNFTQIVREAVLKLGSASRDGGVLKVNTRRFRYTLATRLLQEGASPYAVAAALDHSDLQNVQTYTHLSSGILDHINPAVARELGARAQAFTQIVETEADAVNGDNRSSRRYFGDRSRDIFEPIGNCGHNALCNVAAPLACYVCPKFQPWLDGPHEMVLQSLIDRRKERKSNSSDMRMVGLEDEILVAVANVVVRIDAIKQASS